MSVLQPIEWEFIDFEYMASMQAMCGIMVMQTLFKLIEEKPFGSRAGDNWNRMQMICLQ